MALVAEITKIITVADSSSSLNNKYFLINAVNTDTTVNVGYKTVQYYVWMNVGSAGSDPSISGATGVEVTFAADASAPTVATAVKNKLDAITGFSASVGVGAGNDTTVTVTNANKGAPEIYSSKDINLIRNESINANNFIVISRSLF